MGRTLHLPRLDSPLRDHLQHLGPVVRREVVVFGEVLVDEVKFPRVGIQIGQRGRRDGLAEAFASLDKGGARPGIRPC